MPMPAEFIRPPRDGRVQLSPDASRRGASARGPRA